MVQAIRGFKSHRHRQPSAKFLQVRGLRGVAEMLSRALWAQEWSRELPRVGYSWSPITSAATRAAAIACMSRSTWEYVSSVIDTLA
jgi:hypothetical protein